MEFMLQGAIFSLLVIFFIILLRVDKGSLKKALSFITGDV